MISDIKLKFAFLLTSLETGGIEKYTLRLLEYLKFNYPNIQVDVICKSGKAGALESAIKSTGANIILHKLSYFGVSDKIKLLKLFKSNKYDSVMDFSGDFAGFPLYLAKKAKIPTRIAFYRGSTHHHKTDPLRMLYYNLVKYLTTNNSTKILANSKTGLTFFRSNWENDQSGRYDIIYNGIPVDRFNKEIDAKALKESLGIPADSLVIGHVGRFNEAKNHDTIIKVAEKLLANNSNVYFLLCGRDVPEGLSKQVSTMENSNRIIMPGDRNDIPDLMQIMDIFFFPSRHEGQPNAFLEAIISKLPFVASNIGSIKESIPEKYHNWLRSPGDKEGYISLLQERIITLNSSQTKKDAELLSQYAQEKYSPAKCFNAITQYLI